MNPTTYLQPLTQLMSANANLEKAEKMAAYMRDQFPFLGIQTPQRKALLKEFRNEHGLPPLAMVEDVSWALWQMPEREYQYAAMSLLSKVQKKLEPDIIAHYETLVTTKSWWDTVDGLASNFVGATLLRFPKARDPWIDKWRDSDNFWLRRVAILFQLNYKAKTDAALLFALSEENGPASKFGDEFFIQKAVGWALRQYSKTNEEAVVNFIDKTDLAPLSQREGLKWLKNQKK